MIITFKYRIKDANSAAKLKKLAGSVNFIWNYCNEVGLTQLDKDGKWLSNYDLHKLTAGCTKELNLCSSAVESVCDEFVRKRRQFKKRKLNWRSKKSLGWIPFKKFGISVKADTAKFYGQTFKFWKSREFGVIKTGSFNEDSQGRWYLNLVCEVPDEQIIKTNKEVGVDLGLKNTATYSNGTSFEGERPTRKYADKLAKAQMANKKKQVSKIHAKIKNIRKDSLQKETTRLIREFDLIVVGDVSSGKLVKTMMAKSVTDAGWFMYKSMLDYKTIRFGKDMKVVKENWTSRTCSGCNERSGPKGLSCLSVREWACIYCGEIHDRDVNAAKNILRIGHDTLTKGRLSITA